MCMNLSKFNLVTINLLLNVREIVTDDDQFCFCMDSRATGLCIPMQQIA